MAMHNMNIKINLKKNKTYINKAQNIGTKHTDIQISFIILCKDYWEKQKTNKLQNTIDGT